MKPVMREKMGLNSLLIPLLTPSHFSMVWVKLYLLGLEGERSWYVGEHHTMMSTSDSGHTAFTMCTSYTAAEIGKRRFFTTATPHVSGAQVGVAICTIASCYHTHIIPTTFPLRPPSMQVRSTGDADHTTAVAVVEAAVHTAWKSAAQKMGLKPSVAEGLMLRPVVCVTGCVLILGSVVGRLLRGPMGEADQEASQEAAGVGAVNGDGFAPSNAANLVAYVDGSWTVPPVLIGSGSQRGHIHLSYADLDELKQALATGALEEMLAAAIEASLEGDKGINDGAGSCGSSCAPVVARWGEKVQLRLVDLCEDSSSSSGGGTVVRNDGVLGEDFVRIVVSHHNKGLHDGSEQLVRPGGVGDDGTASVQALAAGSGGSSALIQLAMPGSHTWGTAATTTSSNAAVVAAVLLLLQLQLSTSCCYHFMLQHRQWEEMLLVGLGLRWAMPPYCCFLMLWQMSSPFMQSNRSCV
jgi:hypothetical protein